MLLHGREVDFKMTVMAAGQIAKLCPKGQIKNLPKVLSGDIGDYDRILNTAKIMVIMNEGFENAKKFEDPSYKANPITLDEVLSLEADEFTALQSLVMQRFKGNREVESEPPKKENATALK